MSLNPTFKKDGFVIPGMDVQLRIKSIPDEDRDLLGKAVRDEWIAWAKEQSNCKPSWLIPWEQLTEIDKEVDRRIGVRLANIGRLRYIDVK